MDEISAPRSRLTFGGLATGLDTGALIDALLTAERRPLTLLEGRLSTVESQRDAVKELNTNVLALRDAARAIDNRISLSTGATLTSIDEEFLAYKAASDDDDALEVEVTGDATPGSFEVEVNALATTSRDISERFSDADAALDTVDRSLDVAANGELLFSLAVTAGTSLNELRDAINSATGNDGQARADVIDDGTGFRLVVTGAGTGSENDLDVATNLEGPGGTGTTFFDPALGVDADDAQLSYLGVAITRGSNDIADLVPGVSLRLRDTTQAGQPIGITVSRDDEAIEEKLQTFVDAYNEIRTFANNQATVDPETNRGGVLIGDPLIRTVESTIRSALGAFYEIGDADAPKSASGIGLEIQADGTLELDAARLRAALDQDPLEVRALLTGEGPDDTRTEGLAAQLAKVLDEIVKPENVYFAEREIAFDERIRTIESQIGRLEQRLSDREEFLVRQFSQLESLISSIQSQSGFLGGA